MSSVEAELIGGPFDGDKVDIVAAGVLEEFTAGKFEVHLGTSEEVEMHVFGKPAKTERRERLGIYERKPFGPYHHFFWMGEA